MPERDPERPDVPELGGADPSPALARRRIRGGIRGGGEESLPQPRRRGQHLVLHDRPQRAVRLLRPPTRGLGLLLRARGGGDVRVRERRGGGGGRGGEVFVRRRADGDDLGARRRVGRVRGGADGTGFEIEVAEKENAAILRRGRTGGGPEPGRREGVLVRAQRRRARRRRRGDLRGRRLRRRARARALRVRRGRRGGRRGFRAVRGHTGGGPRRCPGCGARAGDARARDAGGGRGGDEIGDEKRADDDRRRRRLRVPLRRCLRRRPVRGVRGGARARSRALRPPGVHGRALGVRGVAPGRPAGDGA